MDHGGIAHGGLLLPRFELLHLSERSSALSRQFLRKEGQTETRRKCAVTHVLQIFEVKNLSQTMEKRVTETPPTPPAQSSAGLGWRLVISSSKQQVSLLSHEFPEPLQGEYNTPQHERQRLLKWRSFVSHFFFFFFIIMLQKSRNDWSSFESVKCPREHGAMQGLEGSIRAVMHALQERGISSDSLLEIECCMEAGKHRSAVDHSMWYLDTMFEYDQDLVQLLMNAWQALCNYHGLRYKRAYRECSPREDKPFPALYKRQRQNKLAQICTSHATGLYEIRKWQEYLQAREARKQRQRENELFQALIELQQSLEVVIDEQEQEIGEERVHEEGDIGHDQVVEQRQDAYEQHV
jgi:hypothetical protein